MIVRFIYSYVTAPWEFRKTDSILINSDSIENAQIEFRYQYYLTQKQNLNNLSLYYWIKNRHYIMRIEEF